MFLYKITIFIFIFVFLYAGFLIYPIYQSIRISEKIIAESIPYEQHPKNPQMHILVAGDSTAVGVGAVENSQSIAGRLGIQFPEAEITNLGLSGAKLKYLLQILKNQIKNKKYDLIVLQIGANDITHFTSIEEIRSELSEILALSEEHSSKTILLTSGDIGRARVFRWPLNWVISARTLKIRRLFMEEASKFKSISYVDLYLSKSRDPFEKNLKKYYAPDSFHLTGDGYEVWYLSIQKYL